MKLETQVKLKRNSVCLYYKQQLYYTGLTIHSPSEWSDKQGTFTSKRKDYEQDRITLQQLKNQYDNLIKEATLKDIKEGLEVRDYIDHHFKKIELGLKLETEETELIISHLYREFWQGIKKKAGKFSLRSEHKYKAYEDTITQFCIKNNKNLILQLDYDFALDFRLYLTKPSIRETPTKFGIKKIPILGLRNRTLKIYMSNFFRFLKWVQKRYKISFDERIFEIETFTEKQTQKQNAGLALTEEMYNELKAYVPNNKQASQNEAEEKCRDFAVFLCNTGLRYSDFEQLNKSDIVKRSDGYFIRKVQVKTVEFVGQKLNNTALEILKKYDFDFKSIARSNQKANETIKTILSHLPSCQIKKKILKIWLDREIIDEDWFYNLFTLHKCRHTFVSRLLRKGATPASIQKATGWSKLEMINVYMDLESASDGNAVDLLD